MKRSRMEEESTKAERVGGNVALPRRELLKGGIALTGALSMGVGFNSIGAAARAEPVPAPRSGPSPRPAQGLFGCSK